MRGAHCYSGQRDLDLNPGSCDLELSALATELSRFHQFLLNLIQFRTRNHKGASRFERR